MGFAYVSCCRKTFANPLALPEVIGSLTVVRDVVDLLNIDYGNHYALHSSPAFVISQPSGWLHSYTHQAST